MHVFISHSWSYSEHYDRLAEWIFFTEWSVGSSPIRFYDTSVPREDPIHNAPNSIALQNAIYERILASDIVVIPTGMYAAYSHWIQKEIDGARLYLRPIIAVNPWGQQRKASVVQASADETVGWNKETVVRALWNLGNSRKGQ